MTLVLYDGGEERHLRDSPVHDSPVMDSSHPQPSILEAMRRYWGDAAVSEGPFGATRALVSTLWQFLRDSTPARLRQRYGDAEYDWDYRVNTTSAAVGWRNRLLGVFHSPYQPTEPALFHEMLDGVLEQGMDFRDFTFLDLGSGKGRTLLMASDYPFRRIVGVELLPALHEIAVQNILQFKNESQRCFAIETSCGDASAYTFPCEPLLVYLFNPLPESGLRRVLGNLEQSLRDHPRPVYVLYHNPLLEHVLGESALLKKIGETHQYSVWAHCRKAK